MESLQEFLSRNNFYFRFTVNSHTRIFNPALIVHYLNLKTLQQKYDFIIFNFRCFRTADIIFNRLRFEKELNEQFKKLIQPKTITINNISDYYRKSIFKN